MRSPLISRSIRMGCAVIISSGALQAATLKQLVWKEPEIPDPNKIVMGFPIPDPVGDSDPTGFRSHDDIIQAMEDLRASGLVERLEPLGFAPKSAKPILAYRITSGGEKRANDPASYKPQVLFTAGVHAREWIGVEVAARFAEELVSKYPSDPKVKYLLENAEVYVLPDLNVDGRLHTEGHPDQFWELTPYERIDELERHGRMRRKNLDDVEISLIWTEEKTATGDILDNFLKGVDLNRNMKSPGWGHDGESPYSITYKGNFPGSSEEAKAVESLVSGFSRLTAAADIHSAAGVLFYFPVSLMAGVDPERAVSRDLRTGHLLRAVKEGMGGGLFFASDTGASCVWGGR